MRLAIALMLSASTCGAALAQQAGPQEPDQSRDVVIVTGVGPLRSSDELIASTESLDADEVIAQLKGGLGDTLASLPGVASTSFGPGASRPIVRGLGAERVQVLTNGIGVIDASAASPDHAVTADPLGAERIEVLRGPASLAYGGGATGGVVNVIDGLIVDKLPQAAFSGLAYGAFTSVDEGKQVAGRITGRVGPFVAVLNGSWLDAGDIDIPGFALSDATRAEEIAAGGPDEPFANGVLPNSFVENSNLSGGLSWVGDKAFFGAAVRRLESSYGIVGEEGPFIDLEQTRHDIRGGLKFDGFIRDITVTGSTVDYTHTEFEDVGEPGTVFNSEGWEGRIEARHAPVADFEGSFGLQASDRDLAALGDESFITPTNTNQWGVFFYETYDKGEWGLEGGLRHDEVELDNAVAGRRSFDTFNASFGGHTHIGERFYLGASVSHTERAPTDVELFANGPHLATQQFEVGDPDLATEKGVNLELSLRWEGEKLHLHGAVYRFAFDDFIYLVDTGLVEPGPEGDLPVFVAAQDGATFTGAEVGAEMEWGRAAGIDWRSDASFEIVRAELDAGGDVPRIPPATLTLGLEAGRDAILARIEAEYGAEQDRVAAFERPTPDYLVFNASLGWDVTENLRLILEGRNLTDEEVRLHASPLKEVAPQPGRNIRLGLRAKF